MQLGMIGLGRMGANMAARLMRAGHECIVYAPGVTAAPRTPGATGEPKQAECGYLHCGPNGGGHFVKMVHNGIEYGIMAAYSEGLNIIKSANAGRQSQEVDAETTPLRNPEFYRYEFDIAQIAEV